jgi:acyl-CoA thioester hydrolase
MYSTRIYYQDTDGGGIVYFANYLKFFEKSWFEYLLSIGISLPDWQQLGVYIMVKSAFLDLLDKLKYGETIMVDSQVKEVRNSYFILTHEVKRNDKTVTRGETKMVCVDKSGKPKRIPEEFKKKLLQSWNTGAGGQE